MTWFEKLRLKWLIYFKGIRFYETTLIPKSPEFQSACFESVNGEAIQFYFFREECEDLIYKRGQIYREKFIGYVIQAKFDDAYPEHLRRFNNLKFFFNSKDLSVKKEEEITRRFLAIYLDFLRSEKPKK